MQEIRPVPDEVAKNLGANLFFQRMKGHARPGAEMAKVYPNDFVLDFAEAMAIGRRLGKQVIVIGVSNGCNKFLMVFEKLFLRSTKYQQVVE